MNEQKEEEAKFDKGGHVFNICYQVFTAIKIMENNALWFKMAPERLKHNEVVKDKLETYFMNFWGLRLVFGYGLKFCHISVASQ